MQRAKTSEALCARQLAKKSNKSNCMIAEIAVPVMAEDTVDDTDQSRSVSFLSDDTDRSRSVSLLSDE